jgi:plastocyanin
MCPMRSDLRTLFFVPLTTLGLLALLVLALWYFQPAPPKAAPAATAAPARPPFTPAVQAQLAKSRGFAVLISYTDQGFAPAQATIKKGQAIRFTNNSGQSLWVAAQGTAEHPVYPGQSDCGASALDSCTALKSGEFWEFTFDHSGTWTFVNNLDKTQQGAVKVVVN